MIINLRIFFKTKTATTTTAAKVTTANCTTKTSPSKTSTNITQQVQAQQSQAQSQQTIQRSSGTASVTIATTPAQPTKNAIVVANTGQIVQSAQVCINHYFYKILSKCT